MVCKLLRNSISIVTANQLNYFAKLLSSQVFCASPGYYDPVLSKENAKRLEGRFAYVIQGMLDKGWITAAEAKAAKLPPVAPRTTSGQLSGPKGYIIDAVQKELSKLGFSQDQLLVGGYVIKTTLDQRAQQSAVDAVNKLTPTPAPY
jgi:membrane peptidoglycan carboxypeptidase